MSVAMLLMLFVAPLALLGTGASDDDVPGAQEGEDPQPDPDVQD